MNRRLAVAFVALAAPMPGLAETLTASGPRPLHNAVEQLAARHGWRICYEETVPTFSADVERGEPKPGTVAINYTPNEGAGAVLRRLAADHARRGNVGRFEVRREAGRWIVAVNGMRGKDGEWGKARPPLDYPVSLSKGRLGLYPLLDEMGRQLSLHAGFKMWMTPGVASNGLLQRSAAIGAGNETARSVVARMLKVCQHYSIEGLTGWDMDWDVFCGENFGCAMRLVRGGPPVFPPPAARGPLDSLGPLNRR
ncbi:MAG: hypothetical protein C0504_01845 [Candidatus Solibacter sp.]|nr:hypothetical protein [Candidatus Solibacter sp.]